MKKILKKYWAIFFILFIWMFFANPYFLKGLVPYSSTYQVNFFKPWSMLEKFWGPVKNNAMPDVHTQIYPWKKLTIETLRKGELPLWNPYNFSGNPHLANYQSAALSPFNLLFFNFPFIDAWSILILLQPLLAGIFMYLFVREIGVSKVGSLVSSIAFMFCGFIVVWMAYGTLGYAIVYLPLSLFAVERYFSSKRFKFLLLLILTLPLSFFSGHFQISFYFVLGVLSYILYKACITRDVYSTCYSLFSILIGFFLSLPQLLPSIEFYKYSVRSEIFQVSETIPFSYLITTISPDFFGNPVTRNDWFGHYAEWAGFVGIWPFVLALYTLLRRKNNIIFFFWALGIVSLLFAVDSPFSQLLVSMKLPVLSTSALSRIIVLFSFSFAVLAGFGFDVLNKDIQDKKVLRSPFVLLGVLLLTVWILLFIGRVLPQQWIIVAKRNLIFPSALFVLGSTIVFLSYINKKFVLFTTCYLLLAISFDSLRFAQKWMPFDPRSFVYPNVTVINAMKQYAGNDRVFGNIGSEVSSYYGIQIIEGYDPLYIDRYGEFIRSAANGEFTTGEKSVVTLTRNGTYTNRVLDLLAVNVIFHTIADTNQGWAYPVWKDEKRFTLVYKDDKFQLFRNNNAMPRVALFYNAEIIKDKKEIIKRFYQEDFDFRKIVIIEEPLNISLTNGTGSARIALYTPSKVKIETTTSTRALLFLPDNYYPHWKAKVNGVSTKVFRANYTFRAVAVPKGNSTVEFYYQL